MRGNNIIKLTSPQRIGNIRITHQTVLELNNTRQRTFQIQEWIEMLP